MWSDPAHEEEFDSFLVNAKELFTNSMLKERELELFHQSRLNELHGRGINRRRLKAQTEGIGLTKEHVMAALAAKLQKRNRAREEKGGKSVHEDVAK